MIKILFLALLFSILFASLAALPSPVFSQACLPGCCGSICGGCPGTQTCSISNGSCSDGTSCDPSPGITCQYPEFCYTGSGQLGQHSCTGTMQINSQSQSACMYDSAVPTNCTACTPFGNPYIPDNTGYSCTPYDIGPTPTPSGSAPQCSCSDSYSCSGPAWSSNSDVVADNECDPLRRIKDCNEIDDYFCANGPNGTDCYKHYKTSIQMSSTSPTAGDTVNITVFGSKSCTDDNPYFSAPAGMVYLNDYNTWGCQPGVFSCDASAIGDQACQWNYACKAYVLTGSTTANFDSDALMIDPRVGNCASSQNYSIVPQALCNASLPPVAFNQVPATQELTSPWYRDESARREAYFQATIDPAVVNNVRLILTPTPSASSTGLTSNLANPLLPPIGVDFAVIQGICELARQFQVFQNLLSTLGIGNFCPVPTNLENQTIYEVDSSKMVINAERDSRIIPTPALRSCHLADDNSLTQQYGNTRLNQLDTYWGTGMGIYEIGMPRITITPTPGPAFVVDGKLLQDEKRVEDMEKAEETGMRGWYPVQQGIVPLNDPQF